MKNAVSNCKYWIVDNSFYIWAGSMAFRNKCNCDKNPNCPSCKGKGDVVLSNSNGVATGGIYFIFKQIIEKIHEGWTIVFTFDPPRENLTRVQMLDTYKAQREEKPDFITSQMILGKELFSMIPICESYTSDCGESDDVMATIAVKYATQGAEVVVASRDKDMYPLLDIDGISIYRDGGIITKKDFNAKYDFPPSRFNEYLALAGDAADNFKIFKGIGDKAAKDILSKVDHVFDLFDPVVLAKLPDKYKKLLVDENGKMRTADMKLALQLATLDYGANCIRCNTEVSKYVFKNIVETLEIRAAINNINVLFP